MGCPAARTYLEGFRWVDEVRREPEWRQCAVDGEAVVKAELVARHRRVDVVEALAADCPPRAVEEDLQGAGGEAVDVDAAHQPQAALICTAAKARVRRLVGCQGPSGVFGDVPQAK